MTQLGTSERPLRVAIIGSGPSGFYAAEALFKQKNVERELNVHVDMYEKLPVPFGLVRSGVAPDHPKIKNVTKIYDKIALNENFNFIGNVEVSKDITVDELKQFYDALIFTSGASSDRKLNIPGIEKPRSYTATEFVAWYNGHPEYRDHQFDLTQKAAVIIGQGNVAVDVARILSKSVDELKGTDIASHALEALAESKIKDIYMVGRRGPAQAAFTPVEAKELGELSDTEVMVKAEDMELSDADQAELELKDRAANRKNVNILTEFSQRPFAGKSKRLHIVFFQSPKELLGEDGVQSVVLERNQLSGEPGRQSARGTGETMTLPAGLFFRSVGYRGEPMEGVPFREDWGVFQNEKGRIDLGMYTAGWIKRGPSGIIGTNKPCAYETVDELFNDVDSLQGCEQPDTQAVFNLLKERQVRVVSYADWKQIDATEVRTGLDKGKPREKFTRVEDMLAAIQ